MDTVTIQSVEAAGPGSRARRLTFSDGWEPRLTAASVVKELGLEAGDQVARDELLASLDELEPTHARERALRMLGYRDRTEHELVRALKDDGYPEAVARAVVDRFVEVELVNDARFASSWVASRTASGLGRRRIARELREKGVDDAVAHEALTAIADHDEVDRARRALRGRTPETRAERDKLLRRLITRGFDMSIALAALEPPEEDADAMPDRGPV